MLDTGRSLIRRANLRNYLGFPGGLPGKELLERGREQVKSFGGEILEAKEFEVERTERGFIVKLPDREITARAMILATAYGVEIAEKLGAELGRGVQAQAVRIVAVDGEGRTSVDGLWAAGVVAGTPVQTIVAAGDGGRVAVNLLSRMRGSPYVDHDVLASSKA